MYMKPNTLRKKMNSQYNAHQYNLHLIYYKVFYYIFSLKIGLQFWWDQIPSVWANTLNKKAIGSIIWPS